MKIKFLGAAGTVTGSSYILTSGGGTSILIDLGMFQGPAEIDKLNYLCFLLFLFHTIYNFPLLISSIKVSPSPKKLFISTGLYFSQIGL